MLPTIPRFCVRSTCTSCSTPFSTTATRDSIGVMLIRISSLMAGSRSGMFTIMAASGFVRRLLRVQVLPTGYAEMAQQFCGFANRQPDHRRITAIEPGDKHPTEALNAITAGLVPGFAAGPIGRRFFTADRSKSHHAADHTRDSQRSPSSTAMAVSTSCSLPDNIISMAHASASSTGLPRILPSSTTAVSAPSTQTVERTRACGGRRSALPRARRST
jgi:hypothetical protein